MSGTEEMLIRFQSTLSETKKGRQAKLRGKNQKSLCEFASM